MPQYLNIHAQPKTLTMLLPRMARLPSGMNRKVTKLSAPRIPMYVPVAPSSRANNVGMFPERSMNENALSTWKARNLERYRSSLLFGRFLEAAGMFFMTGL